MLKHYKPWPEKLKTRYKELGCWEDKTFGQMLSDRASIYGDRTAIVDHQSRVTYKELDKYVNQLASGFQRIGLSREDRVVVQLPNTLDFVVVIFALFRLGAIPVFSLLSHRDSEIRYFCEFSEAKAYIIPGDGYGYDFEQLAKTIQTDVTSVDTIIVADEDGGDFYSLNDLYENETALPDIKADDVAFFQLSGGSTGLPKMIARTHNEYMYSLRMSADVCQLDETSVYLAVLPAAHNYPLSSPGVLGTMYAGGKVVLSSGASPDEAFPLIEQERVTITAIVPPLALIWLEAVPTRHYDLSSLRVLQVGGSKLSAEAAKKVTPVFGCTLQQVYGMAEGLVNYTRLNDSDDVIIQTQGKSMSVYDDIRVVDEEDNEVAQGEIGELLTRGPYTIRGYYKAEEHNEKAFTADGYYRTGDLVRVSEDGYITVIDRVKDQINRAGEKIAAEEVENYLLAHPAVRDVAIVAMPDKWLGEKSCAFVISRDQDLKETDLIAFLRTEGLADYKMPDRIEWMANFPKTAIGKVNKKELRRLIEVKLNEHNMAKK
ncbi:(2,3-dihydroxybenzoyl)adenylate synthase [Salipaludibacillus agaradhaerens]|uniref:(2,3-dihydroxybenzoyl)adenylate synthase n=1 Tax=Salipaludibacillus agaradhaerens TaxID=76935 RepID=A0A9Q4G0M9_SALAG|nr:(2,3-dihydroxybenzoyl)adenylate synthase [Salipaludibacillus agaradhaerens]MCR6098058.1 (2,3-dihydroxybenzoyl)adenylate synthase [Salipaludibacillus agaradhaerens]MCR6116313.1 (2,3-dihydroxybenzoyl)adenylate synthase [Salipaludibacillus agaradhaerens]